MAEENQEQQPINAEETVTPEVTATPSEVEAKIEVPINKMTGKPMTQQDVDHLFGRAKAAEGKKKESAPQLTEDIPQDQARKLDAREYARLLHEGYSDNEISFVERLVVSENKSASDLLRDENVQGYLEAQRQKAKLSEATPSPSSRTGIVKGKSYSEMKPEEREQNFSYASWKARKSNKL